MTLATEVVIVGAGFAGAATAYQLTRLGVRDVVILEKEELPGMHASARNAAMARKLVTSRDLLPLSLEGISFIEAPPADFAGPPDYRRCGSLMIVDDEGEASLRGSLAHWRSLGIPAEWLSRPEIERRVPVTVGGSFVGGAYCAQDGVVDVAALLDGYLRAAAARGARLLTGRAVVAVGGGPGRVRWVETAAERIETRILVDAAGAWAGEVARLAGACPAPLSPRRRHLVVTRPPPAFDGGWPFVWDVSHELYFRPEPPGLLLSPCDSREQPPGEATVDGRAIEELAAKVQRFLPRLGGLGVVKAWAGLRTATPDGNLVVGRDPRVEGFVWCAGLAGHGMTTSAAVGRLAAEAVLGRAPAPAYDPGRFSTHAPSAPRPG
jgi:D-arginine dehydrogenase